MAVLRLWWERKVRVCCWRWLEPRRVLLTGGIPAWILRVRHLIVYTESNWIMYLKRLEGWPSRVYRTVEVWRLAAWCIVTMAMRPENLVRSRVPPILADSEAFWLAKKAFLLGKNQNPHSRDTSSFLNYKYIKESIYVIWRSNSVWNIKRNSIIQFHVAVFDVGDAFILRRSDYSEAKWSHAGTSTLAKASNFI